MAKARLVSEFDDFPRTRYFGSTSYISHIDIHARDKPRAVLDAWRRSRPAQCVEQCSRGEGVRCRGAVGSWELDAGFDVIPRAVEWLNIKVEVLRLLNSSQLLLCPPVFSPLAIPRTGTAKMVKPKITPTIRPVGMSRLRGVAEELRQFSESGEGRATVF